jgi:hypothetical protein
MKSFVTRFLFLYFLLQAIPLDIHYFADIFSLPWSRLRYQDLFVLAHYTPRVFGANPSFADWLAVAVLALAGALVWQRRQPQPDWDRWRYWVTAIVRYRLAIGLLAYGFLKLYPLQAPFPSLSNLNTPYGDFTRWKLFAMSLGIVPSYEAFLGGVEIVAAFLLLYRRTASIGALIILFFTGNVFMSNLAYEGGAYVYSAYLVSLALFVLSYDAYRLASLLVLRRPTAPNHWRLTLTQSWQRYSRWGLKAAVLLVFVVLYGFRAHWGYRHDPYQIPDGKGLADAGGLYNVTLFRIGHDTLPYSPTDSTRWTNVVFERWPTISIAANRGAEVDSGNTEKVTAVTNLDKTYESQGTNGRRYYDYAVDTAKHLLRLRNKDPKDSLDTWTLTYDRPDSARIVLSGLSPAHDSLYVILDRIDKKYLLVEAGRAGRNNHQLKL